MLTRQIASHLEKSSDSTRACLDVLKQKRLVNSAAGVHQITDKGRQFLAEGRTLTSGPCGGNAATRRGPTLRQRAWRYMRMQDGFGLSDLLRTLCDGGEACAKENLLGYIRALETAGYLLRLPRRGEASELRWRLKRDRDTGPEAPAWNKKTRTLRDHNTGEAFAIPSKEARRAA